MSKKLLSRDDILEVQDLAVEQIDVPEWGGNVCLKAMSAAELMQLQDADASPATFTARVLSLSLVDAAGKRLFDNNGDVEALRGKNARVLNRLLEHALRLNGMEAGSEEAVKKD